MNYDYETPLTNLLGQTLCGVMLAAWCARIAPYKLD
jgi:hypothetical protein